MKKIREGLHMKGVTVSIDRIVIDFTEVYWDFFNEFHKRICHFYGVRMTVGERGFQYRIRINTGEHFLHISYKLVFSPKTRLKQVAMVGK